MANKLISALKKRYELTGGNELQWFLGIEVICDRPKKLIWLSQSAYIEKISQLAEKKEMISCQTLMSSVELMPQEDSALLYEIMRY